jgi:hypothetical protein
MLRTCSRHQPLCAQQRHHTAISSSIPLLRFEYRPAKLSLSSNSSSVVTSVISSSATASSSSSSGSLPMMPGNTTLSPPEYVNPRKFSCTLFVSGDPAISCFFRDPIWMARPATVGKGERWPAKPFWFIRSLPSGPFGVCDPGKPTCVCNQSSLGSSSSGLPCPSRPPPTSLILAVVNSGSKFAVDSSDSTTGLNGGVTCFRRRAFQSIHEKNECSFSSAASRCAPRRCLGFRFKSLISSCQIETN